MKYFLLDDDIHFQKQFKKIIKSKNIEVDVTYFHSVNDFLQNIQNVKTNCNILFLDIDMPECDGITLAKKLYSDFNGLIIIFLTNRTDLVTDAFGLNVFKFISKVDLVDKIESVIQEVNQFVSTNKKISFGDNNNVITISVSEILYFERVNRKSWAILKNNEKISLNYLSIDCINEKLDQSLFAYINRGQIVNLANVKQIKGNSLTLSNGSNIYSSVVRKKEVNEKYKNILFKSI
ncbi:MAG: LytTR family DNA-binding domain-containing protein [Bacilli bacterium]